MTKIFKSVLTFCIGTLASGLVSADEAWSFIHREIVNKRILLVEFRVYENELDGLSSKRVRDVGVCISSVLVSRGFGEIVDVREKVISDRDGLIRGVNFCLSGRAAEQGPVAGIEIDRVQHDSFEVADDHYYRLIGPVDD